MDIVITIIWLIVLGLCLGIAQHLIKKRHRKRFGAFLMQRKR